MNNPADAGYGSFQHISHWVCIKVETFERNVRNGAVSIGYRHPSPWGGQRWLVCGVENNGRMYLGLSVSLLLR